MTQNLPSGLNEGTCALCLAPAGMVCRNTSGHEVRDHGLRVERRTWGRTFNGRRYHLAGPSYSGKALCGVPYIPTFFLVDVRTEGAFPKCTRCERKATA